MYVTAELGENSGRTIILTILRGDNVTEQTVAFTSITLSY